MKKLWLLSLVALLVWGLAGCSSSASGGASTGSSSADPSEDASSSGQKPLVVAEASFWASDDLDSWKYLVLIQNPNESFGWISESFVVEAFDSDGVLLDSDSKYSTLLPKGTLALTGTFYDVGGSASIANLEVRAPVEGENTGPLGKIGNVVFSDVSFKNERWSTSVSGIATSTFDEDQELVSVIIVIRDKSGKVVDADYTYIDRLPGMGKARFEESFFDLKITSSMTIETYFDL